MKKLLFAVALQLVVIACFATEPLFKFGVIADIQYCDEESHGSRYYRNSLQKLDEAVEVLNKEQVQFTVNLGDLVERDAMHNLPPVLERLDKLKNPIHNTGGNHDYWGTPDHRRFHKTIGMPAAYYAFTEGDWRFIMLNTNEVSSYTTMANKKELAAIEKKIRDEKRPAPASYNGGISRKQMRWLERELKKAERRSMNVLVFSHHPLYGPKGLTALNDVEIVGLLSKYPTVVKGAIAGHHHDGAFGVCNGIPFITTEGMVETESGNAYMIVKVYLDKIEFEGRGRVTSYTISL